MTKGSLLAVLSVMVPAFFLSGCFWKNSSQANERVVIQASDLQTGKARLKEEAEADSGEEADSKVIDSCELYVFIAASLQNAMEDVQALYQERQPNVNILYNADSSGTLQTQIEEGAQCDVFFSAAEKQMAALVDGGYVREDEWIGLLENQVVLIKARDSRTLVTGFETITKAANLALAGEDVPVGQYSREIFESLGILDEVLGMEINQGANVTAVLTAVAEMSNEIGIVYATDAMAMRDQVEVIANAPEGSYQQPVVYPAGLVANIQATEAQQAAARSFYEFLQTDEAADVFEAHGFSVRR